MKISELKILIKQSIKEQIIDMPVADPFRPGFDPPPIDPVDPFTDPFGSSPTAPGLTPATVPGGYVTIEGAIWRVTQIISYNEEGTPIDLPVGECAVGPEGLPPMPGKGKIPPKPKQ